MKQKEIVPPEDMVQDVMECSSAFLEGKERTREIIKAVLIWLAENPGVPTVDKWEDCKRALSDRTHMDPVLIEIATCIEWQRRMFMAPEPYVPEEIKDMLCLGPNSTEKAFFRPDIYNKRIIEAFRRGQKAAGKLRDGLKIEEESTDAAVR